MAQNTATLKARLDTDGFVAVPGFLALNELQLLEDRLERFLRQTLHHLPREHVFYEDRGDPASLKQIQQLGTHDAWFGRLLTEGRFRDMAATLLGGPVVPKNLQYFNKPPGGGQATPPHQDGHYFMLSPCRAVTMWLAIDPADDDNGCVHYVRASHLAESRPHARTGTLGFSRGITDFPQAEDLAEEVVCTAQPGDLLVHHAMTIHWAGPNKTASRSRRALGFIYYSVDAQEDSAAHARYQQQLAKELKRTGRI